MRYRILTYIKDRIKNISVLEFGVLFIAVAVFNVILMCYANGISGNDFWWHVKVGEWIVENGKVPTTDIFSWYGVKQQLPWTAHEWLADVIYYEILQWFGQKGVFVFVLMAALGMAGVILWQVRKTLQNNLLIGGVFLIGLSIVLYLFFYGRPHMFSFFLLFFELKILYEFWEKPDSKKIFFLPIIGCLWSNLHGGSSNLAYILCFVFVIVGLLKFDFGRIRAERLEKNAILKLFGVGVLTILSLLINPVGMQVLTFPYISVGDELMMSTISEWQAPDAKDLGALIFYFFPIVLMTIGIVAKECKIRFVDIVVMGMFLYLFFRSSRFIMLWYIAACFYAFRYLPKCNVKELTKMSEKLILYITLFIFMVSAGFAISDISKLEEGEYISTVMSEEAIGFVKQNQTERMFNDYNLGEALIYNDIPVFFDARADMYLQENIYADGLGLTYLSAPSSDSREYMGVDGIIEKYQFDSFLILKSRALYTYLQTQTDKVKCIYEDESLAYFIMAE